MLALRDLIRMSQAAFCDSEMAKHRFTRSMTLYYRVERQKIEIRAK
jgi:hypothetical protein